MGANMENEQEIEELEVGLLLQAIYSHYGYRFTDYAKSSMRRRVRSALARSGLGSLGEMQHKLLVDRDFFATVLDELTVRVSDLFRDPAFYRCFREHVVPILQTYPLLKIWHAGCASGEELYTTAILLWEENLYERAQLYATDMSPKALEMAREGVYSAERATAFEQNYRDSGGRGRLADFFSEAYGGIVVRETLRKNAVFFQHDLASDYALGEMNVVFCRNVLIYFGSELRAHALRTFSECVARGGFLCLGMQESLAASTHGFSAFSPLERIYRRQVG